MNTDLVCIRCPLGCRLKVSAQGEEIQVEGNRCPKGEAYSREELTAPRRTLTTSVKVLGGELPLVSIKTASPLPKHLVWEAQDLLRHLNLTAPVSLGQTVVSNLFGLGIDVVATREVPAATGQETGR